MAILSTRYCLAASRWPLKFPLSRMFSQPGRHRRSRLLYCMTLTLLFGSPFILVECTSSGPNNQPASRPFPVTENSATKPPPLSATAGPTVNLPDSKVSNAETTPSDARQAAISRLSSSNICIGESALVDKETGRVFWQQGAGGSSSSSLLLVVNPYLRQRQGIARHLRATILSFILWFALTTYLANSLRATILSQLHASSGAERFTSTADKDAPTTWNHKTWKTGTRLLGFLLHLPQFSNGFVITVVILYLVESYTSSTRRYLNNALSSPSEVENYIEALREKEPVVLWKVQSFHYERRKALGYLYSSVQCLMTWINQLPRGKNINREKDDFDGTRWNDETSTVWNRRVVTHQASLRYKFARFDDNTVVGLWKRSRSSISPVAPFTKLTLTKMLVLADGKARSDYFAQQSQFVTVEGQRDEYAEFSTSIQVEGFKPKLLAIRPVKGLPSTKLFRIHLFWIFTLLGLTLPYRIWFAERCDELRVTVVKETWSTPLPRPKSQSASNSSPSSWLAFAFDPKSWFATSDDTTTTVDLTSNPTAKNASVKGETFRQLMRQMLLYDSVDNLSIGSRYSKPTKISENAILTDSVGTNINENAILALNFTNNTSHLNVTSTVTEQQFRRQNATETTAKNETSIIKDNTYPSLVSQSSWLPFALVPKSWFTAALTAISTLKAQSLVESAKSEAFRQSMNPTFIADDNAFNNGTIAMVSLDSINITCNTTIVAENNKTLLLFSPHNATIFKLKRKTIVPNGAALQIIELNRVHLLVSREKRS